MQAINTTSFNTAFDTSFQTVEAGQLADVGGGFGVGPMIKRPVMSLGVVSLGNSVTTSGIWSLARPTLKVSTLSIHS